MNRCIEKDTNTQFCPYKLFETLSMVAYKLGDFSGKPLVRHRSNVVPYYPKELIVAKTNRELFF